MEAAPRAAALPAYDATCYLCPGNQRAYGTGNPDYATTFAFDNDFPALRPDPLATAPGEDDLLKARGARGICRVLCFSPRHDLTLGEMEILQIRGIVDAWAQEVSELGARSRRKKNDR